MLVTGEMIHKYISGLIDSDFETKIHYRYVAQRFMKDYKFFSEYMERMKTSKELEFVPSIDWTSGKLLMSWLNAYRSYIDISEDTILSVFALNNLLKHIVPREEELYFEKLAYIDGYFQQMCDVSIYDHFGDFIPNGHHWEYASKARKWKTDSEFKVEGIDV